MPSVAPHGHRPRLRKPLPQRCSCPEYDRIRPEESSSFVLQTSHLDGRPYAFLMGFGARLREKRKEKGLTQEQVGEGLGTDGKDVGKAVVYGWEKEQHFPRVDQLATLCERHQWSADYLLLGKASASDLSSAVAQVAAELNKLQPKQLEFVLDVLKPTLATAKQIVAPTENHVAHATDEQGMSHDTSSAKRRVS